MIVNVWTLRFLYAVSGCMSTCVTWLRQYIGPIQDTALIHHSYARAKEVLSARQAMACIALQQGLLANCVDSDERDEPGHSF